MNLILHMPVVFLGWEVADMDRKSTVCVLVGLSFKLIWSFYKDYILVHRAIPKSEIRILNKFIKFLTPEQYSNLLDWTFYR